MTIVSSRPVVDKTQGLTHMLSLDLTTGTYTLQVNGVTVTAVGGTQSADQRFFSLTGGGATFVFSVADLARVCLGGGVPPNTHHGLIGWLLAELLQAGTTITTILTTAPLGVSD